MDILIAVFPCSSIEPVDVTVNGELGDFLEVDDLRDTFLLLGVKMGCSIQDLMLWVWIAMPEWLRVSFCAFRCCVKRWLFKLFTTKIQYKSVYWAHISCLFSSILFRAWLSKPVVPVACAEATDVNCYFILISNEEVLPLCNVGPNHTHLVPCSD